jgi:hypothetical protein
MHWAWTGCCHALAAQAEVTKSNIPDSHFKPTWDRYLASNLGSSLSGAALRGSACRDCMHAPDCFTNPQECATRAPPRTHSIPVRRNPLQSAVCTVRYARFSAQQRRRVLKTAGQGDPPGRSSRLLRGQVAAAGAQRCSACRDCMQAHLCFPDTGMRNKGPSLCAPAARPGRGGWRAGAPRRGAPPRVAPRSRPAAPPSCAQQHAQAPLSTRPHRQSIQSRATLAADMRVCASRRAACTAPPYILDNTLLNIKSKATLAVDMPALHASKNKQRVSMADASSG